MLQGKKKKSNGSSLLFFPQFRLKRSFLMSHSQFLPEVKRISFLDTLKKTCSLKWLPSFAEPGPKERINSNYPFEITFESKISVFSIHSQRMEYFLKDHKREYSYFFVTVLSDIK